MTELHLTDEQLAALADGSMTETDRALLIEHVRTCNFCHESYLDAVRYRAMLLTDASIFRAPDAVVRLARSIPSRRGESVRTSTRTERRRWFAPPALAGLAAAALIVAALAMWQAGVRPGGNRYDVYFSPLQQAAVSSSTEGSIILPGTEETASVSTLHRSGIVPVDETIASALAQLTRAYREDANPEVAHWLISGFLATGDLEQARLFAQDARLRFSGDARFLVLDAIVAYRSEEFERAERLLQAALETDPNNGAALMNLALVQYETGRVDSARRTLELVRTQFAGSPLEARAQTLISGLLNG
ncbi:MAG TPA: tetratricopeptide repeat protein [Candidatus Krumholzibacteria bacterium]|nr:tetratricopeptide repeat protein [Candidatus Krumholzibacteria bacterium]